MNAVVNILAILCLLFVLSMILLGWVYDFYHWRKKKKSDMKCPECGGELEPVFRPSYVKDGCAFDGIAEEYIGDKCVECDREYEEK